MAVGNSVVKWSAVPLPQVTFSRDCYSPNPTLNCTILLHILVFTECCTFSNPLLTQESAAHFHIIESLAHIL